MCDSALAPSPPLERYQPSPPRKRKARVQHPGSLVLACRTGVLAKAGSCSGLPGRSVSEGRLQPGQLCAAGGAARVVLVHLTGNRPPAPARRGRWMNEDLMKTSVNTGEVSLPQAQAAGWSVKPPVRQDDGPKNGVLALKNGLTGQAMGGKSQKRPVKLNLTR